MTIEEFKVECVRKINEEQFKLLRDKSINSSTAVDISDGLEIAKHIILDGHP